LRSFIREWSTDTAELGDDIAGMGIYGLTWHCNQFVGSASRLEDLGEVSCRYKEAGLGQPLLIVDGYALLHELLQPEMPGWQWTLGGEYTMLDTKLRKWIGRLRMAGVDIVFTFDPSHGTEEEEEGEVRREGRKDQETRSRFAERCAGISKIMSLIHEGEELGDWSEEDMGVAWQLPPLSRWQAIVTLEALGDGQPSPPSPANDPSPPFHFLPVCGSFWSRGLLMAHFNGTHACC